jgi:predicted amidophosphoribosyltransferase
MEIVQYILGFFVCVGPLIALVAYMMWASRRPHCANCRRAVKSGDTVCRHCGQPLAEKPASK